MKKQLAVLLLGACLILSAMPAFAQVNVRGYYRSNGTYVQPHVRTAPNTSTYDNWSTKGNYNPYTGQQGSKNPSSNSSNSYNNSYSNYGNSQGDDDNGW